MFAGGRAASKVFRRARNILPKPISASYVVPFRGGRPIASKPTNYKVYSIPLDSPSRKVRVFTECDLVIKPVDPASPKQDHISVRALGPDSSNFNIESAQAGDIVSISAGFQRESEFGEGSAENKKTPLEIQVPFHRDVEVSNEQGNVSIQNVTSPTVTIKVKNGSINCKNVRSEALFFECENGSVECEGLVQGNINIRVKKKGDVKALNFQGGKLKVQTDCGNIFVASTYCEDATFLAVEGNVFLKNAHQTNRVSVKKGNVNIAGLDGTVDLLVLDGNINVQLTQLKEHSYVEAKKGNIVLSMEKEDICKFHVHGRTITLKDDFQSLGRIQQEGGHKVFKTDPTTQLPLLKVVSREGDVCLEKKSWIQAMLHGTDNGSV